MSKRTKVLIVEDEEALSRMYKIKFEKSGYQAIIARDGDEVMPMAISEHPDIILLDIILPKKDGFSVLEDLKKNKETKDIKVLMMTNLDQEEDFAKSSKLGAADHLVKANLTPTQLVDKVVEHLKK